jgi:NAD(P)-dependent dehydrogenase (short-subunit alcohol dehydrogenase family)
MGLDILVINAVPAESSKHISVVSTDDFDKTMKTNPLCDALDRPSRNSVPPAAFVITTASVVAYGFSMAILLDYVTTKVTSWLIPKHSQLL